MMDRKVLVRAIRHLRQNDPVMAKIIERVDPLHFEHNSEEFASLLEYIIYQQLALVAARKIHERFEALFKSQKLTPQVLLRTPDAKLRQIGLSTRKIGYMKDLARHVIKGRVNFKKLRELSDEEVIEKLTRVKGIGQWTTQMFLIFTLGRTDVLPTGDFGFRKGVQEAYKLSEPPSSRYLLDLAETWRPYRSIATMYIWKNRRLNMGLQ